MHALEVISFDTPPHWTLPAKFLKPQTFHRRLFIKCEVCWTFDQNQTISWTKPLHIPQPPPTDYEIPTSVVQERFLKIDFSWQCGRVILGRRGWDAWMWRKKTAKSPMILCWLVRQLTELSQNIHRKMTGVVRFRPALNRDWHRGPFPATLHDQSGTHAWCGHSHCAVCSVQCVHLPGG